MSGKRFVIIYLLIVLAFLFFLASSVNASALAVETATPTPTITTKPLIILSTPTPFDLSSDCPEDGIVDGWGTVTPSALWSAYCSQCIVTPYWTSTAKPAPTWDGTGTPPPTETPTLSPSATFTPSPTSDGGDYYLVSCSVSISQVGNGCGVAVDNSICELQNNDKTCHCLVDASTSSDGEGGTHSCRFGVNVDTERSDWYNAASHIWWTSNVSSFNSWTDYKSIWTRADGTYYVDTGEVDARQTMGYRYQIYNDADTGGQMSVSGDAYISTDGSIVSTPTPSPTPDGNFCDTVQDENDTDPVFGYTGIEYGAMYCADLLPFDISILGVDMSIPHFAHICLQDVSIGTGTMFGMSIDLDVALFVAGVAWAIRNLFIS